MMKDLVRVAPFKEMRRLRNEIDRLFDLGYPAFGESALGGWIPSVDVREDESGLAFVFELAGMSKDGIKVDVENNVLTVSGERKFESGEQGENYHLVERGYGSFRRSFSLPNTVDPSSAIADYKNGLLTVKFDKRPEVKGRQIEIK